MRAVRPLQMFLASRQVIVQTRLFRNDHLPVRQPDADEQRRKSNGTYGHHSQSCFGSRGRCDRMLCASPVLALDNAGSLEGVVKNAAGQPVTGAFVRLKNNAARPALTFMVVSQDRGAFSAKDLPPGNYTVQGIGGQNQSAISAPVAVASGKASKIDVALSSPRGPMLTPAWPGRVPEVQVDKDLDERQGSSRRRRQGADGREMHRLSRRAAHPLASARPVDDWTFTVRRMRVNMAAATLPDITRCRRRRDREIRIGQFQTAAGRRRYQ